MRDLYHKLASESIVAPQTIDADFVSSAVTLTQGNAIRIDAHFGTFTFNATNRLDLSIYESDDDSTYTKVTDQLEVIGQTLVDGVFQAVGDSVVSCSYVGSKKYIKLYGVEAGTVSVLAAATAIHGELSRA